VTAVAKCSIYVSRVTNTEISCQYAGAENILWYDFFEMIIFGQGLERNKLHSRHSVSSSSLNPSL